MKTVFLRLLEAEDKAAAMRNAILDPEAARGRQRFDADPAGFASVPRSPFAYWVSKSLLDTFTRLVRLESAVRTARGGLKSGEDYRFVRTAWETRIERLAQRRWRPFAKGGSFSRYYADVHLAFDWLRDGAQSWAIYEARREVLGGVIRNPDYYFRPGITWPLRTNGLSFRALPTGCIFGHKGPSAFVAEDCSNDLLALAAITNSQIFSFLVSLQLARTELAQSYEVGLIQQTPVPELTADDRAALERLALRAWSLKRRLDTRRETSHAFVLPTLLQVEATLLRARASAWGRRASEIETELAAIQVEIDERCFELYGMSDEDQRTITAGFASTGTATADESAEVEGDDDDEGVESAADASSLVEELASWAVGVTFGRFDVQLATGERALPGEPSPFDPLPACSAGMLTGDDGLPLARPPAGYPIAFPSDGILVDDPGHARDLLAGARHVFDVVFGADADARWNEAADILEPRTRGLRAWLARDFFERHVKRYSKSRRKAPIYWQLATPSGGYSVWLFLHRLTHDTFYTLLNDFVTPKLRHEEQKLVNLGTEAGERSSATQRAQLATQDAFVNELRAFRDEVARVAPLWNPDLDDGVILNFAPLWRLVPHHRGWQRECKAAWDKLCAGDYDWAHLAMHLWPERVVPKCAEDRSLAIAHGLEEEFWFEGEDGKWRRREVSEARVQELIRERTSSEVNAALQSLLEAAPDETPVRQPRKADRVSSAGSDEPARPRKAKAPKPESSTQLELAMVAPAGGLDATLIERVMAVVEASQDGTSRADVLAATGISDADWMKTIGELLAAGRVRKEGEKRGTRYFSTGER